MYCIWNSLSIMTLKRSNWAIQGVDLQHPQALKTWLHILDTHILCGTAHGALWVLPTVTVIWRKQDNKGDNSSLVVGDTWLHVSQSIFKNSVKSTTLFSLKIQCALLSFCLLCMWPLWIAWGFYQLWSMLCSALCPKQFSLLENPKLLPTSAINHSATSHSCPKTGYCGQTLHFSPKVVQEFRVSAGCRLPSALASALWPPRPAG